MNRRQIAGAVAGVSLAVVGFGGAGLLSLSGSSSSSAAEPCQRIGFQSGIVASAKRWRTIDPAGRVAYTNLERSLQILAHDHDALCAGAPPVTTTQPPTTTAPAPRYAPRTHNLGARNQDPRFCLAPQFGGVRVSDGYRDATGAHYDFEMRSDDGNRDRGRMVDGLKGADSLDSLEPCDAYTHEGRTVPPYPADSFLR